LIWISSSGNKSPLLGLTLKQFGFVDFILNATFFVEMFLIDILDYKILFSWYKKPISRFEI